MVTKDKATARAKFARWKTGPILGSLLYIEGFSLSPKSNYSCCTPMARNEGQSAPHIAGVEIMRPRLTALTKE